MTGIARQCCTILRTCRRAWPLSCVPWLRGGSELQEPADILSPTVDGDFDGCDDGPVRRISDHAQVPVELMMSPACLTLEQTAVTTAVQTYLSSLADYHDLLRVFAKNAKVAAARSDPPPTPPPKPNPFHLFITGPGGTGKSYTVAYIRQLVRLWCNSQYALGARRSGADGVLVAAYSGTAAHTVKHGVPGSNCVGHKDRGLSASAGHQQSYGCAVPAGSLPART